MSRPTPEQIYEELDRALENGVGRALLAPSLRSAESLRRLIYVLRREHPKAELYQRLRLSISPIASQDGQCELWIVLKEDPSAETE